MADPKEAMFYEKKKGKTIQCFLCPRHCVIKEGERGNCRVRENRDGKLYSLVYGELCALAIDPIEKKPIFHFLPGISVFSVGTAGCNLHCKFCQNWTTSQADPEDVFAEYVSPKELVTRAVKAGCKAVAYTYNEPIIYYEYALDSAKEAKKKGLRNIAVCNGFIEQKPLKEWCKYIDAFNIDLKGFTEGFYKEFTGARLKPVLETIKTLHKEGVWLELTNLIIPGKNDDMKIIKRMCKWIVDNIGKDVPLHFSAFFPCYQMQDTPRTPKKALLDAKRTAEKAGINFVYIGNAPVEKEKNTYCPKSKKLAIERGWFEVTQNNISKSGICSGEKIPGVWK